MLRLYSYKGCDSCRKALKWLKERNIEFENLAIRETSPKRDELAKMLSYYQGDMRRLFNVSGGDYRALNLKDKISSLSEKEAFDLLGKNGNLVKRPFAIWATGGVVGFKETEWIERWGFQQR
jgi:arsenate reductase